MKKVWIINQYGSLPSTGMGGRHRHFSRELTKLGHKVTLVSARWTHGTRDEAAADSAPALEVFEGFRFLRIPVNKYKHAHDKKRVLNWFSFAWRIRKLPQKLDEKPDVIIYSSPSLIGYLGAFRLAKKTGAKLIFEVRDIWPLSLVEIGGFSHDHLFIKFLQWIEDLAYKKSNYVISNLKGVVSHIESRGIVPQNFSWIPNGFSKEELDQEEPAPAEMLAAINSQPFSIVYTGALGAANCIENLIEAASILKSYPDIHFNIVGRGMRGADIRELVKDLDLKNVHCWGSIKKSQVQSVLRSADVCYIGLTKDPLFKYGVSPNKLFDYLYSGRPIVYAIDSGGYRPVSEAAAGIQVKPECPQAVADAVVELFKMPKSEREEMGSRGRKLAMSEYEYGLIAEKLSHIFESLNSSSDQEKRDT